MRAWLALFLLFVVQPAYAQVAVLPSLVELRVCWAMSEIPRTADGTIKRSSWVRTKFQQIHPCPVTGSRYGACPGWAVDHIVPLACGGCDSVNNMQWLPDSIKSTADPFSKDRWERRVYCSAM